MIRTPRLLRLARERGDLASTAILEADLVADVEALGDEQPIGTVTAYLPDGLLLEATDDDYCTVVTGIYSRGFCGGTRADHKRWDGPFHAFSDTFTELPSTDVFVDSGNGLYVNVGR